MTALEFCEDLDIHKTRMNGLSCGEESMTICSIAACDGQTDGRTDGRLAYIAITCFSIADARKNAKTETDDDSGRWEMMRRHISCTFVTSVYAVVQQIAIFCT